MATIYMVLMLSFLEQDVEIFSVDWKGKKYEIEMPSSDYKIERFTYIEGVYYYIGFPDSSEITLHIGSNVKVPILERKEYKIQEDSISRFGRYRSGCHKKNKKLYWAEINATEYNLYFVGANQNKLEGYNNALKSIRVTDIND